jgi:hypothetical protein
MLTRRLALGLSVAGIVALSGGAIAAAKAVPSSPAPSPVVDRAFLAPAAPAGAEDNSTGDRGRDHPEDGGATTTVAPGATTPATVDDRGGQRGAEPGEDRDGQGDRGRNHPEDGVTPTTTRPAPAPTAPPTTRPAPAPAPAPAPTTPTTVDDHGGQRAPGVSDDGADHDAGDDHGGSGSGSGGKGRGHAEDD